MALAYADFREGRRFKVVKPGCGLTGLSRLQGGYRGWGKSLAVGDVLTCLGSRELVMGDGMSTIKWGGPGGEHLATDCEFVPSIGGVFSSTPDGSCLEPLP